MTEPRCGQSRFWDVYSYAYDAIRFSIPYQRHLREMVGSVGHGGEMRVLDLGCATGNLEQLFSRAHPMGKVVGLDYSEGMLQRASRKCAGLPGVSFVRADLRVRLPFPDASFGAVVANNVLYTLEDKASLLAEVLRVLAPGGTLVLSDPKPGARVADLVRAHFAALSELPHPGCLWELGKTLLTLPLMGVAPILLSFAVIGKRVQRGEYHFSTSEELASLLGAFPSLTVTSAYADQSWMVVAVKPGETRIA